MRLWVGGTRTLADRAVVWPLLDRTAALLPARPTLLLSGGARGADTLAEEWAVGRGIPLRVVPADWSRWGRSAGPRRNGTLAAAAEAAAFFWDLASRGTADGIARAEARGLPLLLWPFPGGNYADGGTARRPLSADSRLDERPALS
jgi:hypothetical protein